MNSMKLARRPRRRSRGTPPGRGGAVSSTKEGKCELEGEGGVRTGKDIIMYIVDNRSYSPNNGINVHVMD